MFLENRNFYRIRYTQTTNSKGERVVTQDSKDLFTDGSIQPITEEERQNLEGADRHTAEEKLITAAEIRTPDQYDDQPADEVELPEEDDVTYQVEKIAGGYNALIPHNSYALIRVMED